MEPLSLRPVPDVPSEIRRLFGAIIDDALDHLVGAEEDLDRLLVGLRRRLDEARTLLRLVRPAISEKIYSIEEDAFRNGRRLIRPSIESAMLLRGVDLLEEEHGETDRLELDVLRARIESRHLELVFAMARSSVVEEIDAALRASRIRVERMEIDGSGFAPLREGLAELVRSGAERLRTLDADRTGSNAISWRRRLSRLRHAAGMLCDVAPGLLRPWYTELDELCGRLDRAEAIHRLRRTLKSERSLGSRGFRSDLRSLCEPIFARHVDDTIARGLLLYAEPAEHLAGRIGRYWMAAWPRH